MTTDAPTQAQLLTLAQWFSPSFPVGAFSYSHGLEWAIEAGDVTDAASLRAWVEDVLSFGSGRSDAVFLAASYQAGDVAGINATARAFAPSRERAFESAEQGRAFARAVGAVWRDVGSDLMYPVAVGVAARAEGLPLQASSAMYLHAFVANLAAVGMRLVPLGQTDGQAMIRSLAPLCEQIAAETTDGDLDRLSGTTFLAFHRGHHERHLHSRRRRSPDADANLAPGPDHRGGNGGLPPYGDPRGCLY